jgi:hypothetical protein
LSIGSELLLQRSVKAIPSRALADTSDGQGEHVDPRSIWREYARSHGDPAAEALADFALRLFAIVPNSAAVERLFSKFGLIHTKLRNRLGAEKVRKTAILAGDIANKYGAARTRRRKRKFGGAALADGVTGADDSGADDDGMHNADAHDDDEHPADTTFAGIARDLVDEVDEADLEDALSIDPAALVASEEELIPLTRAEGMFIANLFASVSTWADNGAAVRGLKQFWKLGQDGLARELQFQEAVVGADAS